MSKGAQRLSVCALCLLRMTGTALAARQGKPANSQPSSETVKDIAKDDATLAKQKYKLGEFAAALAAYTKAYELLPVPALLFNLGQCEKNLSHYERALFFFEGYLRDEKRAENQKLARELIAETRVSLDKQKAEEARVAQAHKLQEQLDLARENAIASSLQAAPGVAKPTEPPPPLIKRWWFWTALSVGVLAVATGTFEAIYWSQAPHLAKTSLGTVQVQ